MDDMTPFEQELTAGLRRLMGPVRPVDDAGVLATIVASRPRSSRLQPLSNAVRLVVTGVIVALFGGLLLTAMPTTRGPADQPPVGAAPSPSAVPSGMHGSIGFLPRGQGWPGSMVRESVWMWPSADPTDWSGWTSDGDSILTRSSDGTSLRFWSATPDGVYADPCAGVKGEPTGASMTDLAAAVAAIPGTVLVSGPEDLNIGGRPAQKVVLSVPEDAECTAEEFMLWYDEGLGGRSVSRLGDTIRVWIVDMGGALVWIDGETPKGAAPAVDEELRGIVRSLAPVGPVPSFAFPPPGPLAPGVEYEWVVNPPMPTRHVKFGVPSTDWRSNGFDVSGNGGGSIERGTYGTPDWALVSFSRPDRVYADPCAHTLLEPPLGPTIGDLAAAIAAIPGTDLVTGPTPVTVAGRSAMQLVLRVGEDIGCDAQDFYLWADECVFADHLRPGENVYCREQPHPRAARAPGSTIRLWIVDTGSLAAPASMPALMGSPFLIEAETLSGVSPIIEEEIQEFVASIPALRGWSG